MARTLKPLCSDVHPAKSMYMTKINKANSLVVEAVYYRMFDTHLMAY